MVVPTGQHVEQLCNAMDAERAGLAQWRHDFDLSEFTTCMDDAASPARDAFRRWVTGASDTFLRLIEEVAYAGDPFRLPDSASTPHSGRT